MRTCDQCREDFTPSSRHRKCPACRGKNSRGGKSFCLVCNSPIWLYSTYCKLHSQTNVGSKVQIGETRVSSRGYVLEYVGIDNEHPRCFNGYVFQHTLVMEKKIERHLVDGETAHHKNGVRADNRPENLELWCKPQPTGVRARDVLLWAKEIIALYEGIDLD